MLLCESNTNANPTRPTKNTQNLYFRTENVHESTKMYSYFGHRKEIYHVYSKNTFFSIVVLFDKNPESGPFSGFDVQTAILQ